jgi:FkbM family methyltransferase
LTGILRSLRKRLSGRRKTLFHSAVESLLQGQKVALVDVGAAGALPPNWEDWRKHLAVTAFEPDPAAAKKWKYRYPEKNFQVVAQGLSQQGGPVALHVLNAPTGSSLKKLKTPISSYVEESYCFPVREVLIETIRLEDGLKQVGKPTFAGIKLDTQGSELEILQSLPVQTVREAVFIETEIGMPGAYADTPGLADWLAFLEPLGFELFDLHPLRTPLAKFQEKHQDIWGQLEVPPGNVSVSQRLWEADALFFNVKKLSGAAKSSGELAITVACLCLYRFFLEALDLVERGRRQGIINPNQAQDLRQSVLRIHRHLSRDAMEVGPLSRITILGEIFGSRRHPRWCQYRFYEAPHG